MATTRGAASSYDIGNKNEYLVMTLHRPANVDEEGKLKALIDEIIAHSNNLPLVFSLQNFISNIFCTFNNCFIFTRF